MSRPTSAGAPEFFSNGSKLLTAATEDGRLDGAAIRALTVGRRDLHFPKPRVATITQSTETGRVYAPDEIASISATCRELGLRLHMDGRALRQRLRELGRQPRARARPTSPGAPVSTCSASCGTKNGMAFGEAVVFFDRAAGRRFRLPLQAGRPAGVQDALPRRAVGRAARERRVWLRNGAHANACAKRLAAALAGVPGLAIAYPVEGECCIPSGTGRGARSGCARRAGASTRSSAAPPASCAAGTRIRRGSTRWRSIYAMRPPARAA